MRALLLLLLLLTLAAHAADWPQWHGLARDGVSRETGLLARWPAEGPRLLWAVEGLGAGYGSVAVAGDALYFTTDVDHAGWVYCLDLKGVLRWKTALGPDGPKSAPYARSTPTVDGDRLYVMSALGVVACLDTRTGAVRWTLDTRDKYGAQIPPYGIAESVAIAGDLVICTPGGDKASVLGIDKRDGMVRWATTALHEPSGYNQPLVITRGKRLLAVVMTGKSLLGLDAATGAVRWRVPYGFDGQQCFTPLFADGILYAPVGPGSVGVGFALSADGGTLTKRWTQPRMTVNMGGLVAVDGCLYGANGNFHYLCLDLHTGDVLYETIRKIGLSATLAADGKLITCSTDGLVSLAPIDPTGYAPASHFTVTRGTGPVWSHPALANGVLYLRRGDVLLAYGVGE